MLTTRNFDDEIRPSRRSVLVTLLILAFATGMIAGAVGVRALEEPLARALLPASAATMVPFKGVSDNNMSDAVRAARPGATWFRGVADHNMTDAARAASQPGWFKGVADNNMSDAADRARWGSRR